MKLKFLAGPLVAVAAILGSHSGYAQDNQDLLTLLPKDPNGFVKGVQQALADADLYKGRIHGSLTKATIAAIGEACRQADLAAICGLGPLTPKGAAAVVAALDKLTAKEQPAETPAPAAAETPAPETPVAEAPAPAAPETPVAEPAAPAPASPATDQPAAPSPEVAAEASGDIAPTDWWTRPHAGLTATATAGDDGVQFDLSGTSEGTGWVNIFAGEPRPAQPGSQWTFTVAATFTAPVGAKAVVRVGARRADGSYIAELVPDGAGIFGEGPFEITGTAPPETASIEPYIQFGYPAGTVATGTLKITHSTIAGPTH